MRLIVGLLVAASTVAACSVDPSLTCGASCSDAGVLPDASSDATVDQKTFDATQQQDVVQAADAPKDSPIVDSPTDSPLFTDGACTTTCPNGSTCNGSFCQVPQGTACSSAVQANGSSGSFDGIDCSGTNPTITTTCTSPITGGATFLDFTSGGDPWNVTIKAVNGPLQIEVMSNCSTGASCTPLNTGASTTIVVNSNSVVAIVSNSSCVTWEITYISK